MGTFLAGLMNGMTQGKSMGIEQELKKQMLADAKLKSEQLGLQLTALKTLQQDPTNVQAQVVLAGGDPKKIAITQGLNQLQKSMDPQQISLPSPQAIGGTGQGLMPRAETPGATFPMGLTAPTAEEAWQKLNPFTRDILNNQMGLGSGQQLLGRHVLWQAPDGKMYNVPYTKEGFAWNQAIEAPPDISWQTGADNAGLPVKIPVTKQGMRPPGIAPIRQPVEQPYVSGTGQGGEAMQIPVPKYATTAQPITVTVDPSAPDAEATLQAALKQVQTQKKGLGSPRGAIQTSPSKLDMVPSEEDRITYKHPVTLETAPQGMTAKQLMDSGFIKLPTKNLGTEDAAKLSSAVMALPEVDQVRARLFPNGQLDRPFANNLYAWYKSPTLFSGTEADKYGRMYKSAMEAQIRLESGAAVPPEEVKRLAERTANNIFSSPDSILTGIDVLKTRLTGTVNLMDPSGYYRNLAGKGKAPAAGRGTTYIRDKSGRLIAK